MTDQTPREELLTGDPLILDRYVTGESDAAEVVRVERWVASDPAAAEFLAALRRAHEERGATGGSRAAAKRWARMSAAMRASDDISRPARVVGLPTVGLARPISRHWRENSLIGGAIAAAVVLASGGVALWSGTRFASAPAFREFASATGSRATVTLRDGTMIVLGPASHVRVPADFGVSARVLELTGEAQFRVVHDAAHPFSVHTARAVMRDVGTTFVVRAYSDDDIERVVVQEGQVDVGTCRPTNHVGLTPQSTKMCAEPGRMMPLTSGDLATVGDTLSVRRVTDMGVWTAWVQGGLEFEDTPFQEVVQDIGRAFGVPITVADSALLVRHITAKLSGQPLDLALDAVTQAVGARFERTDRGIVIRSGLAGTRGVVAPRRPLLTTVWATKPSK